MRTSIPGPPAPNPQEVYISHEDLKHRGSVPTIWRLIAALPVAETYTSSPGLQKSSRSAGSKALAISRNQQRTGKKTASHRQARRRSQAKQSKIAGYEKAQLSRARHGR